MTDATAIAAKLTKAQRAAITRWPSREHPHCWAYKPTMSVLDRMGLVSGWQRGYSGWAEFSPLGLAVRTILQEQPQ